MGVATTYRVPGGTLALLFMTGIVGARAQDLQPDLLAPPPQSAVLMPAPVPRLGVLLPLSGRQQALGRAVRDGLIAGKIATGDGIDVEFFDEAGGVANAYTAARAAGATVVVGPLLKESVEALLSLAGDLPVLALNNVDAARSTPPGFYQFGLAPEDETGAVAARALAEGRRRAIALAPDNEWGRRLINAFNASYTSGGGSLIAWEFYPPGAADMSAPVRTVLGAEAGIARKQRLQANLGQVLEFEPRPRPDADFILVMANAAGARLIRPALRFHGAADLPAYATSAIYEDGARDETDLDGMMFPDSPWVIAPDDRLQPARSALARSGPPGALAISRLYALGFDALALGSRLASGALPTAGYAGATGRLTLDAAGRFHRELGFARIDGGAPVPLAALPPAASPDTTVPQAGAAP